MTDEQREIIDAFETVDIVLRAYLEKEFKNDNLLECKTIDNLIYGLQRIKYRISEDYSKI